MGFLVILPDIVGKWSKHFRAWVKKFRSISGEETNKYMSMRVKNEHKLKRHIYLDLGIAGIQCIIRK